VGRGEGRRKRGPVTDPDSDAARPDLAEKRRRGLSGVQPPLRTFLRRFRKGHRGQDRLRFRRPGTSRFFPKTRPRRHGERRPERQRGMDHFCRRRPQGTAGNHQDADVRCPRAPDRRARDRPRHYRAQTCGRGIAQIVVGGGAKPGQHRHYRPGRAHRVCQSGVQSDFRLFRGRGSGAEPAGPQVREHAAGDLHKPLEHAGGRKNLARRIRQPAQGRHGIPRSGHHFSGTPARWEGHPLPRRQGRCHGTDADDEGTAAERRAPATGKERGRPRHLRLGHRQRQRRVGCARTGTWRHQAR